MRSECMFEMNGIKRLNFIEVHTCKKYNHLLINEFDIILFQLLNIEIQLTNKIILFLDY